MVCVGVRRQETRHREWRKINATTKNGREVRARRILCTVAASTAGYRRRRTHNGESEAEQRARRTQNKKVDGNGKWLGRGGRAVLFYFLKNLFRVVSESAAAAAASAKHRDQA